MLPDENTIASDDKAVYLSVSPSTRSVLRHSTLGAMPVGKSVGMVDPPPLKS